MGVIDDFEGIDPYILQLHYGVDSKIANSDRDNDSDAEEEHNFLDFDQAQEHFEGNEIAAAHKAVAVPNNELPFTSHNSFLLFRDALHQIQTENIIPYGYGVTKEELKASGYLEEEILTGGQRGQKVMRITLPMELWLPRAILCRQALEVLSTVAIEQEL